MVQTFINFVNDQGRKSCIDISKMVRWNGSTLTFSFYGIEDYLQNHGYLFYSKWRLRVAWNR